MGRTAADSELMHSHEECMQLALAQAREGERVGEIPVGAVVVLDGQVIAAAHNQTISDSDPTAHAEVVAIRAAAKVLGNYRLDRCVLYVSLEPCAMCMGAILHSRIAKLYFGAFDPKAGACGSVLDLSAQPKLNHHCEVHPGISQARCAQYLSDYFLRLRADKRKAHRPLREDALRMDATVLRAWMPDTCSVQVDDLEEGHGLRVQVWQHRHPVPQPRCLLLCLHGATSWSYLYHGLLSADIPADVMVWAIDLPGHGNSDKTKKGSEFDTAFQLQIVKALVARANAQAVHIVAQDVGCELGIRLAADIPDRIHGMTLLNPGCSGDRTLQGSDRDASAIRSKNQFKSYIARQCGTDRAAMEALCAPYPDAGHLTGMLGWLNSDLATSPPSAPLPAFPDACSANSTVHVGPAFVDRSRYFIAKFGLTFKTIEHNCAGAFLGLSVPGIWTGVLRQIGSNG